MLRVHTIKNVDEFVGVPGDPEGYADSVEGMWESGESRPDWCFVLEDGPDLIGRIGFQVTPTVSDPAWLGSLPPEELFAFGLHLPWERDYHEAGIRLLGEATETIAGEVPELLEIRINNSFHSFPDQRRRLMEEWGMGLFQEKHGFSWSDDGLPAEPGDRLVFRNITEIGVNEYRAVMAPCGEGTLDRNDRYYWTGCGPENWATQMTEYFDDDDGGMWLVGYIGDEPVGYVAVASDEEWGSTIAHVGVVPEHRGKGYIRDLLTAGTNAAREAGISTMLSDVDALNEPMQRAMQRAGHVEDRERWHHWVYRMQLTV